MWLSKVIIQVWPSGGDLAATAEPTAPVPPGLLSTSTFQPVLSISLAWMMRATGSVEPPGGKGTMILTGPLGHSPTFCARTMAGAAKVAATVPARTERRRSIGISLPENVLIGGEATAYLAAMSLIKGETGDWEVVLGLEVHAQVISEAKLFSGAPTAFGADPNTQVSLVDAAMPGMLPVINARCVEHAVRTGLGLQAKINLRSLFDRKNYFYADLPQGYQISQYKDPIVGEGQVEIDLDGGKSRTVGIERLHLEQDAAKTLHDQHPSQTYVDLNRSGVALMEIVSKPDMRTSDEAAAYLTKLRSIVRYLGTCDGNMDEGSMRCDVNVSVRKPGGELGTRCEIKNVNSIRFVKQAIEYEARRQIEVIEGGGKIVQETRRFDPGKGETRSLRSKEDAHDYRYFPDPDLPPLVLTKDYVEGIRASLPELPDARKARFTKEYGLAPYDAGVLVIEKETAVFFEAVARGRDAREAV